MKSNSARALLVLAATFVLAMAPLQAQANDGRHCSNASTAGNWAYTYTGTLILSTGAVPVASVGSYTQDSGGNIAGTQTRSTGGSSGVETIAGTVTVNSDCTGTANIDVYQDGVLQRSAVLALAYDNNGNHARMIFQSLTLPDGTNLPVVITVDANRLFSKH
jgi:hypothetical protein